ncbi:Dihydrolipoyllysine-residue acetyltransferase component 3 of pyruvate dehydrogenase complex [Paramuricea clavata]|uniref:Dihydrolipoyllysine-residue acetyltransferase component 3 of pyruvate dehydrogenase complex n=1 Tax=Paramuricea clavata TaxID=317549 RepID=A0A6S7I4P1_PARCT|nr:Dihydrolipoyllysine-residue acetyltransferase component 3 of pyruvate dehydrogenase complex [Paramuricea clavata]
MSSRKSSCAMEYCQNGGTAITISAWNKSRQRCICVPGYTGRYCQHVVKSCRRYSNSRTAGQYKVFDDNMNLFDVFCDFDSNSTTAWTLVQSYQLQNYHKFMKSFNLDNPINENTPRWDFYSLSKSRMESIRNDSSKWRITCEYDTEGVVYTDYMEGWNDIIDIMTYEQFSPSFVCSLDKHKIDYVDVRGQNCRNCTVPIIQAPYNPLHLDIYFSMCDFKPTKSLYCDSAGEDNFGRYLCTNPNHRCSFPTATTQTWFGSP